LGEEFKLTEVKEEFSSPEISIELGKAEVLRAIFLVTDKLNRGWRVAQM
jgi:hypothetical protein